MKNDRPLRLTVRPLLVALMSVAALLSYCAVSRAQTPTLEVYYDKLDPKTSFNYKWKGEEKVCNVGAFRWEVPMTSYSTGGLDRNFTGYCAEIDVTIVAGKLYRFKAVSLNDPRFYGMQPNAEGIRAAERRATLIRELFGRYYSESKSAHPDNTFAFQLALWELTHETEPADRMAAFDLYSGDFQVNYPNKEQSPAYVVQAQQYLDSLVGNDAIYYENPSINGRELVRLDGIPNADGIIAQSQYALRYINGGAPGVGPFANALGATGTLGAGGIGGAGGFAAMGAVGIGSDSGNPGGGPLVDLGATTGINGTTGPPTTTHTTVPTNRVPITPVPAPPALLLGLVAVGAFASRRIYSRLMQR